MYPKSPALTPSTGSKIQNLKSKIEQPFWLPALALLTALALAGCAGPRPAVRPALEIPADVHPGFDTWRYPGDEVFQAWREASPYQWVGYYLPAPCHRDSSWMGRRQALQQAGWGLAVVYVGQQVFEGQPAGNDIPDEQVICSRTLLTPEQGRRDAQNAIAGAAGEGFPPGTVVYLNVEAVSQVGDSLAAYYRAWQQEMLREGSYVPGTYVHRANAPALFAVAREVFSGAGRGEEPPFWVAGTGGFALNQRPERSGHAFADVWQGALNVQRTWGGVTLQIDENVAARPHPSAPRSQ
ncbi:MAG TPA: glycoside hydrolase domain-containing protein [Rhodothermales bacterium]|nr:glycoside hydrolase domain-containing protein [Rhodothermales bacterium]